MPVIAAPTPTPPTFTLSIEKTLYLTEDNLSWLAAETGTDILLDAWESVYATEDALTYLLAEDGLTDLITETSLDVYVDLTSYLKYDSVFLKFNTLDLTLIDPPLGPAPLAAGVKTSNPTWAGNVTATTSADPIDKQGHVFYTVTGTNTATLPNDTAPFDLSDTPVDSTFRYLLEDGSGIVLIEEGTDFAPGSIRTEGSLAYGYSGLSVRTQINSSGPDTKLGQATIHQPGLRPGNVFLLTSANQGYLSASQQFNQVAVAFPVSTNPVYSVEFGDTPQTLAAWTQITAPVAATVITPPAVVPSGPTIYGKASLGYKLWPQGGGILSIASATFSISAPIGHTLTVQLVGQIDCRAYAWDNYVATPRRAVRGTISGGIFTGAWQETPAGTATTAGARATYDLSSAPGIALASGTYTVTIDIDTQEFNQLEVFSGYVQVAVSTV